MCVCFCVFVRLSPPLGKGAKDKSLIGSQISSVLVFCSSSLAQGKLKVHERSDKSAIAIKDFFRDNKIKESILSSLLS